MGHGRQAIYEVDDLQSAIVNVAQTQLKEVFGSMTFTQAMESQEVINAHMMRAFGPWVTDWLPLAALLAPPPPTTSPAAPCRRLADGCEWWLWRFVGRVHGAHGAQRAVQETGVRRLLTGDRHASVCLSAHDTLQARAFRRGASKWSGWSCLTCGPSRA